MNATNSETYNQPDKETTTLVLQTTPTPAAKTADADVSAPSAKKLVSLEAPGAAILAAEEAARVTRERAEERVASLLADARTLSGRGDHEMAVRLAREATLVLPDATAPHSALAIYSEKLGRKADVVAALENVVALNPNSTADVLKLRQLRDDSGENSDAPKSDVHPPRPSHARNGGVLPILLGGVAALGVLVVGLAAFAPSGGNRKSAAMNAETARGSENRSSSIATVTEQSAQPLSRGVAGPSAAFPSSAAVVPLPPTPIDVQTEPLPPQLPTTGTNTKTTASSLRSQTIPDKGDADALPNFGQRPVTTPADMTKPITAFTAPNWVPGVERRVRSSGASGVPQPARAAAKGGANTSLPLPGASSGNRSIVSGTTTAPPPPPGALSQQQQPARRPSYIRIEVKSGPPSLETTPEPGRNSDESPSAPPPSDGESPPALPVPPPQESDLL